MRLRNARGETIVEVLIALTVLGSVIVGAYAIATRSLNRVTLSHERGEALKIAEKQSEEIRMKVTNSSSVMEMLTPATPPKSQTWFGVNDSMEAKTIKTMTGGVDYGICIYNGEPYKVQINYDDINANVGTTAFPAECVINGRYHIYISTDLRGLNYFHDPMFDNDQLRYEFIIAWERPGGGGIERVTLQNRFNFW